MLENERTAQMLRQMRSRSNAPAFPNQIATYIDRDPKTGDRLLALSDGGEIRQAYISNSKPQPIPTVTIASTVPGLPGFTGQKPS